MAIFHHMSPLLTFDSHLMPTKFSPVKQDHQDDGQEMKPVVVTFPVSWL